ncbi:hypothetical protein PQQ77_24840 [Paraburkholderia strydomiana]|uniref:hypothetical protein n=1 Tax=Paraburkholderia strydomiana TaxID=1245417 RepID=UPI0038B784A2
MVVAYEPLFREGQSLSDMAFEPLRIDANHEGWREFKILIDFYKRGDHRKPNKTGVFSPKFGLKSKLSGDKLLEFARANGDADVCIVNAFPSIPYWSLNVWMQGEGVHPGLTERAQRLLDVVGIEWDLSKIGRQKQNVVCYSNFWLGSPAFWEAYVGKVLLPIAQFLERHPSHEVAQAVLEETDHTERAPFLPFIIERLFSTFLSFNPDIKVVSYPLGPDAALEYCLTDFERDIVAYMRPLVDAADEYHMPAELARLMGLLSKIHQRYILAQFAHQPNPHSGKPYNATLEVAVDDLRDDRT